MFDFTSRQESFDFDTDKNLVVIGAGGIGWNFIKYAIQAGINKIIVFDHDKLEPHNLSRIDAPLSVIGMNKATLIKSFANQMRPDAECRSFPFKFNPDLVDLSKVDIIVDCSDRYEAQVENYRTAKNAGVRYMKLGYDGSHITIANTVPEWDATPEAEDNGYTIVPSFISPASIVASLALYNILTDNYREVSCDIKDLYVFK